MEAHPRMASQITIFAVGNSLTYARSSGDTGVSASLILRGTPPFQIFYLVQRDREPPREYSKTFSHSRGELSVQPERSGHYVFTFVRMSDANYRRIALDGPTIEQIIHPLASADFADSQRAILSTCSGSTIDVDVHLRVRSLRHRDGGRAHAYYENREQDLGT